MHHRMPPAKMGWPSLNVVIFPPHPGRPKTVTTSEISDQIHELILEDRRISAKSITAQLDIRHPPHWLSSKGPNYQRGVLLISADAIEGLLKEKRRGKVIKGVSFMHDNAPAHGPLATQKKMAYLSFHCLDHPPHSPDLAPLYFHLFPGLRKQVKGRHFSSDS